MVNGAQVTRVASILTNTIFLFRGDNKYYLRAVDERGLAKPGEFIQLTQTAENDFIPTAIKATLDESLLAEIIVKQKADWNIQFSGPPDTCTLRLFYREKEFPPSAIFAHQNDAYEGAHNYAKGMIDLFERFKTACSINS